jgi:2-polyprenyl-3-methyl-5-hydroxy-6-metoxy-1,4-benzoquinol methylase
MRATLPKPGARADEITRRVRDMYSRFPYPSIQPRERRLRELANLLRLFAAETRYDFAGKRVLDVGTGTGHRLVAAARDFPSAHFTAVDLCDGPLAIARATAAEAGVSNVTFLQHDVMDAHSTLGVFDVILCMGVLHHLPNPTRGLQHLTRMLADDGVLLAYLYGALGSVERMHRKEMLALLLGEHGRESGAAFDAGIRMAKALNFTAGGFGWNRNADDDHSADALIVDRYLHVNEALFDTAGIAQMVSATPLDAFMVYGITTESRGYLFDTALDARSPFAVEWTDMAKVLRTADAMAAYRRLPLRDRYRLVELAYLPSGYTVLAYGHAAESRFTRGGRVRRNALMLRD